jgi:hypothetical protein
MGRMITGTGALSLKDFVDEKYGQDLSQDGHDIRLQFLSYCCEILTKNSTNRKGCQRRMAPVDPLQRSRTAKHPDCVQLSKPV